MPLSVGEPCSHEKIPDNLIAQEHFEHLENEVATLQVSQKLEYIYISNFLYIFSPFPEFCQLFLNFFLN